MPARGLLIALLFLTVSPQTQLRLPVHIESLIYPPVARQARIHGDAVLSAHIGTDGSVSIPILKSGHPMLLRAAEDNLKKWKFQGGEEQEMEITYHFKFGETTLDNAPTECSFDLPNSVTVLTHVDTPQPIASSLDKPTHK